MDYNEMSAEHLSVEAQKIIQEIGTIERQITSPRTSEIPERRSTHTMFIRSIEEHSRNLARIMAILVTMDREQSTRWKKIPNEQGI